MWLCCRNDQKAYVFVANMLSGEPLTTIEKALFHGHLLVFGQTCNSIILTIWYVCIKNHKMLWFDCSIQMKNHNAERQKWPFPSLFTMQDTGQENKQDIIFTVHETEQVSIQVIVLFFKTTYNNRESEEIPSALYPEAWYEGFNARMVCSWWL